MARSIEFRCGDSKGNGALAETKNGTAVCKHVGYEHIPQRYAAPSNAFAHEHLNSYVNLHRPCFFAEAFTDAGQNP